MTDPGNADEAAGVEVDPTVAGVKDADEPSSKDRDIEESPAIDAEDESNRVSEPVARAARRWRIPKSARIAAGGIVLVLVGGGLTAWQGWEAYRLEQQQRSDGALLQAARQGVINLTTIDFNRVDADVARVLDSSTGSFRDDFAQRSQPFADVVKQAKSVSVGTVTEAALESSTGTHGQALVAVSVKTSDVSGAEQQPRLWRMRVSVDHTNEGIKVSNVEFVP